MGGQLKRQAGTRPLEGPVRTWDFILTEMGNDERALGKEDT